MSTASDDPSSMRATSLEPFALDAATAEALLDGRIEVDDAPPGYGGVVAILRAADAPIRPDEVDGAPEAIRRIFDEARQGPKPATSSGAADTRRLAGRWSLRAAVVAIVAMFTLGGGVAMAATGNLPGPLQSAASRALGVVGISVPDGVDPSGTGETDGSPTPASTEPTSTVATTPSTTTPPPTTTEPPIATTVEPGATPPATDGSAVPGRGDEVCPEASNGRCQAGQPNPSDTRPGAPVDPGPPTTRDNPSATAPGQVDNPSATAPGRTR